MHSFPDNSYADAVSVSGAERQLFRKIAGLAEHLGAQACAYCIRMPLPLSRPRSAIHHTYPAAWRRMAPYQECIHGAAAGLSHAAADAIDGMLVLPPCHFHPEPGSALLREHAWAWRDARGAIALLTAVADPGRRDAARQDAQLTQLARNAHAALAECMIKKLMPEAAAPITPRERQVLIWTAEGKSVPEISCILGIAESTVSFHVRNVIAKLRASNRAHAAVKAALLGML